MNDPISRLQDQVRAFFLRTDGKQIPSVTPYRFTVEHIPMPQTERPYLYIVLDEHKNVTEASVEVGYESLSQFIRDYRKMFGAAPREDILNLQKSLKE